MLLFLSVLHSVSSVRPFPSSNAPLAIWVLLPVPLTSQKNKYGLVMYFTAGLILFDIIYLSIHGPSITSPDRISDISQVRGVPPSFVMILASLRFFYSPFDLPRHFISSHTTPSVPPFIFFLHHHSGHKIRLCNVRHRLAVQAAPAVFAVQGVRENNREWQLWCRWGHRWLPVVLVRRRRRQRARRQW